MTSDKTVYAGWYKADVPEMLNGEDHFAYVIGSLDGTVRPNANISRAPGTRPPTAASSSTRVKFMSLGQDWPPIPIGRNIRTERIKAFPFVRIEYPHFSSGPLAGGFGGQINAARAQAAAILMRFIGNLTR